MCKNHMEIYPFVVEYQCSEDDGVEIISAIELPTGYKIPVSKMPDNFLRDLQDKIEELMSMSCGDRYL